AVPTASTRHTSTRATAERGTNAEQPQAPRSITGEKPMSYNGMHLTLQIPGGQGSEFANAWRLPAANKLGFIDADVFVTAAKEAERGKFDAVFLADRAAIEDDLTTSSPRSALEPVVL